MIIYSTWLSFNTVFFGGGLSFYALISMCVYNMLHELLIILHYMFLIFSFNEKVHKCNFSFFELNLLEIYIKSIIIIRLKTWRTSMVIKQMC